MIRILLADDNAEIRSYFHGILDREPDFRVVGEASSGAECIRMALELKPDIILMDIQMETETAGIDATAVIHEKLPDTKIIILTIHSDDEMLFRAYSSGALDFIVKTDSISKIVSSIQQVSRNQLQLRSDVASKIVTEFQRIQRENASLLYTLNILSKMTNSELEVLCCLYNGDSYKQVAKTRFVSEATIKSQVNSILKKFGMKRMKDVVAVLRQVDFSRIASMMQRRG
ncbi:MAG: response regulator transcription factor [Clostridiales bacterium]|nr:response regulator transcription factor [Clostridiales bacterium]